MCVGTFLFTGPVHVDSRWQRKSQVTCILHFWKRSWVNIYWFFCQYLTPGVIWGLYVHVRDTLDAMRQLLVDITSSRIVFSAILVPRDVCDNSKMCVRARSLVRRLLSQTSVWSLISLEILENGLIQCLRRGSSPHESESVENRSLWTKIRPQPWWWNILLCDSGFYGSFFYSIYG